MSPSITISNNPSFSYTHRQIAKRSVSFPACGASLGALQGAKWGSKSWVDRGPQQPLPSSRTTMKGRVRNATHCERNAGKNAGRTWASSISRAHSNFYDSTEDEQRCCEVRMPCLLCCSVHRTVSFISSWRSDGAVNIRASNSRHIRFKSVPGDRFVCLNIFVVFFKHILGW